MGGALAVAAARAVGSENIAVFDADSEKTRVFCKKNGTVSASRDEVVLNSEYIFLGVKPQMLDTLFSEIGETLKNREKRAVIVSMAAGVSVESVRTRLKTELPIIRIMPNMPVSVGEGTVLYCADGATDEEKRGFCELMKFSGLTDELSEDKIDAASCVSGCGPAFAYMFIEALADGAVACGLPRDKAIKYAAGTLLGSAKTVLVTGKNPEELKDAVCSPAGSTIEGVFSLEEGGFRAAAASAVRAAYKKTLELGK